ncbi:hypothetical protein [Algoriphagus vanfongensis]|uniref:hypothetical protein n=1 Tax=Algoriphagus vanfongensis TaxID=426371 RepID=UPI0004103B5C|nr:hypothetical protein [Algoriphagus vanfongensis]
MKNSNKEESKSIKSTDKLVEEAKVTQEDLQALGSKDANLSHDGGADEALRKRKRQVDFSGKGLDVPGEELDDAQEAVGSEDEENNHYSLSDEKN